MPTISLFEVFKRVLQQRGEESALEAVTAMRQGTVVELTASLALLAARTSVELGLPMADSIMLATSQAHGALFWTQDADFEPIAGVKFVRRARS